MFPSFDPCTRRRSRFSYVMKRRTSIHNVMLMDCVLFHVLPGLPVASDSAGRKWRRRRCLPLLTIAARHGLLQSWLLTPDTPTPGVIEEHGASLE
eukprot:COSAG02_NODE_5090_length_4641_cov_4.838397_3_plen_95_part_00